MPNGASLVKRAQNLKLDRPTMSKWACAGLPMELPIGLPIKLPLGLPIGLPVRPPIGL